MAALSGTWSKYRAFLGGIRILLFYEALASSKACASVRPVQLVQQLWGRACASVVLFDACSWSSLGTLQSLQIFQQVTAALSNVCLHE
mgnify:CR=1 FL=1